MFLSHTTTMTSVVGKQMFEGVGAPVHVDESTAAIDPTLDSCCQREVSYIHSRFAALHSMHFCVFLCSQTLAHVLSFVVYTYADYTHCRLKQTASKVQSKRHFVPMIVSLKLKTNVSNSTHLATVAVHSKHSISYMDLVLVVVVAAAMIRILMVEIMNCWLLRRKS